MKTKKTVAAFILGVFSFVTISITSCSTPEQKVEKAEDNVANAQADLDKAQSDYEKDVRDFRTHTDESIAANEMSIAELNKQAENAKQSLKKQLKSEIAALERKNAEMRRRMDEYRADGNEKWQSFKREFNHDMDELGSALKDLTKNNVK
jgi:signal transduction protein with GAF and PtsI domain